MPTSAGSVGSALVISRLPRCMVTPRSPSPSWPSIVFSASAAPSMCAAMRARPADSTGTVSDMASNPPERALGRRLQQPLKLGFELDDGEGNACHFHRAGITPDQRHDARGPEPRQPGMHLTIKDKE